MKWKNKTECELREIGVGMYERGEDIVDIVHYIFTRFGTFIEGDEFEAVIFNKTSEKKIMARVNLGTYPVGQAKSVARIMRRMKNNKNVSFAKPVNVVLRGRGKRLPSQQSSVPLDQATGAAIYFDIDVTKICKDNSVVNTETLKELLLARAKVNDLNEALKIEANKRFLPTTSRNIIVANLALSKMKNNPQSVYNALVHGCKGYENFDELELIITLTSKLQNENCEMEESLL